jgi:ABC-2 type transport system permease protein
MSELSDMIWVESRKAIASRMPVWTALGSMFMPIGIAFLIFVARNPDVFRNLGLVSAKANLLAYSAVDWPAYLSLYGQLIAAGGFFLFILITSWVFGREFADGTVKDILAVPVGRSSIILGKFIVMAVWSVGLSLIMLGLGLVTGAAMDLPGGSVGVIIGGSVGLAVTAGLVIAVTLPFALLASAGRGYLLPIGVAVLTLMAANLVAVIGWGEYFPWAVPAFHSQGSIPLAPISYWIVFLTGLAGALATYLWWKVADQSR